MSPTVRAQPGHIWSLNSTIVSQRVIHTRLLEAPPAPQQGAGLGVELEFKPSCSDNMQVSKQHLNCHTNFLPCLRTVCFLLILLVELASATAHSQQLPAGVCSQLPKCCLVIVSRSPLCRDSSSLSPKLTPVPFFSEESNVQVSPTRTTLLQKRSTFQ